MSNRKYHIGSHTINSQTGCWIWNGSPDSGSWYGRVWVNGKRIGAHRAYYEHYVGPIPNGFVVLHLCDVPLCVNPNHLRAGTQKENVQDAGRKGRLNNPRKLSKNQVIKIKTLIIEGELLHREIADIFCVTRQTIGDIKSGKSWRWIEL